MQLSAGRRDAAAAVQPDAVRQADRTGPATWTRPGWRKVAAGIAELVGRGRAARAAAPAPRPSPAARERLLAVLAFDNLSGDPEMAYFSDGVSEEIQQTVAQGADLKVVGALLQLPVPRRRQGGAQGRVRAERHAPARRLGAAQRRAGAHHRPARRVRRRDDAVVQPLRRRLTDIFALQDQIAAGGRRGPEGHPCRRTRPGAGDRSPRVYEQFLKARARSSPRATGVRRRGRRGGAAAERGDAAAPDYAPAWELLASARAWTLRSGHRKASYAMAARASCEAAETALRLDPKRGGAYAALAMLEPWGAYARARARSWSRRWRCRPTIPGCSPR